MPSIHELTRIEPVHLERLDHQGVFTTGILLEVSETPTRRQTLADQVAATTNDVLAWRDEALMLNLAGFGPAEHDLFMQAGIEGLRDMLALSLDDFRTRLDRAARAALGTAASDGFAGGDRASSRPCVAGPAEGDIDQNDAKILAPAGRRAAALSAGRGRRSRR